jgi:hypothetical protein
MGEFGEDLFQIAINLKGQRVEMLRVVQSNRRHAVVILENETVIGHRVWISS